VSCGALPIGGELTQLCTYFIPHGSIVPYVLAGRLPTTRGEIAIGRGTAHRIGASIGDSVTVDDRSGSPVELTIVGTVVNPNVGDSPNPGEGAIVPNDGMEQLIGSMWDQPYATLVVDVDDDLDPAATGAALALDHPIEITAYSFARPPDDLVQLGRMRPSLIALAIFLGALGAVGLIHYLVLSARRRGRQIAVLRALGFVRGQVCESVSTQAVTVAACGLLIGMPLGIVVGRWSWLLAVRDVGVEDAPAVPWSILGGIVVASVVGSAAVALYPGWASTRSRPSHALRTE
jgi:ABC-type lipoprotein release transport system permease subunit